MAGANRRFIGYKNRAVGETAEAFVEIKLREAGFMLIERVHTPWRILWKTLPGGRRVPDTAWPEKKVSGDFRAIEPRTGKSVLVESKCPAGNLLWSIIEPHQREALDTHAAAGGITYLAWVKNGEVRLIGWPVHGFMKGTSLKWAEAS